jgi:spermidine/putrescine transport system substrate-binding protein
MKLNLFTKFASAGLALALAAGCGGSKKTLHVYTWADYVAPELLQKFEKEFNCKVVIDTFDSNETLLAKLTQGAGGYDVMTPTTYMSETLRQKGLIIDLDLSKIPNAKYVDTAYLKEHANDKEMKYSVPYMIGNTGIGYLKDKVQNFEPSWTMFERADLKGRMTLMDDIRETIGAALKTLGYSMNSTNEAELMAAKDLVIKWKKNIAKFENEQYKTGLASAEFFLVHGYNGDIKSVATESNSVTFVVPREGAFLAIDDLVITKDSKNVDLAYAYINFLHDPANAAANSDFITYVCPNKDAYPLMSKELRRSSFDISG